MELINAVQLTGETCLAFVGAGGKSTAMFRLAKQWVRDTGKTVLVTTTTHLAVEQMKAADHWVTVEDESEIESFFKELPQGIVAVTGPVLESGKVGGLSNKPLDKLYHFSQEAQLPLLIEADGSRQRPLKAPAAHEPVIPPFTDSVIVVVGLQVIGKKLKDVWVHRPDQFSKLTGLADNEAITAQAVADMLLAESGGLKGIPDGSRKMVLFNQCDTGRLAAVGKSISRRLLNKYDRVIYASLMNEGPQEVIASSHPVAGMILAAGGSERIGRPKQLLDWNGQPFVRVVAETALLSALSPVYVVVGAYSDQVVAALEGLDVVIIHNSDWAKGQSTSVKVGVESLSSKIQAVVIMLVDQPQIPHSLIETLVEAHASQIAPVVATMVEHRRGNPVLFDRATFADLVDIEGDVGGRKIFSRHRIHYVPWLDDRIGMDVDTLEDYNRLLEAWEQP